MEEFRYSQIKASCSTYLRLGNNNHELYCTVILILLDEVFLCHVSSTQIANSINRHYSNVFNCTEKILQISFIKGSLHQVKSCRRWIISKQGNTTDLNLNRFSQKKRMSNKGIQYCHLEGDQVPPNPRPVRGLDVLVKVVQDNVIDVFIPSKNLSYLSDSPFSNFYSMNV